MQTGDEGTACFVVTVDGERLFESGEMKGGDAAKNVHVSLAGAKQMTLTAGERRAGQLGRRATLPGRRGRPARRDRHGAVRACGDVGSARARTACE